MHSTLLNYSMFMKLIVVVKICLIVVYFVCNAFNFKCKIEFRLTVHIRLFLDDSLFSVTVKEKWREMRIIRHSESSKFYFSFVLYYADGVVSHGFEVNVRSLKTHVQQIRDKVLQ